MGPRYAKEKQFAFLGIFSSEPFAEQTPIELEDLTITRRSSFNLGIVWYGHLVEEIVNGGVRFGKPESAAPNGGPATALGSPQVTEGPPSVS